MKNTPFEQMASVRLSPEMQRKRLNQVIQKELTDKQRQVLIAYYFEDMNIPQIAARQGVHKSTVWRTLRRAEARIKRCLQY